MGGIQSLRAGRDLRGHYILDHNLGGEMSALTWKDAAILPEVDKTVILHFGFDILEIGCYSKSGWELMTGLPPHTRVIHWAEFNYPSEEGLE
jgi:hypothetical protein